jgi:hypothetical protein
MTVTLDPKCALSAFLGGETISAVERRADQ